jgi:hypothetical protein
MTVHELYNHVMMVDALVQRGRRQLVMLCVHGATGGRGRTKTPCIVNPCWLMAWYSRGGGSWSGCMFPAPQVGARCMLRHAANKHYSRVMTMWMCTQHYVSMALLI